MPQPDEQDRVTNPKKSAEEQPDPKELVADVVPASEEPEDADAVPRFVTRLTPLEEQVGMHVITALQHPETLAVLTTVAADGTGSQQVVSIPLDANRFAQVQQLLSTAKKKKKRTARCVGFHCSFEDKDVGDEESGEADANDE